MGGSSSLGYVMGTPCYNRFHLHNLICLLSEQIFIALLGVAKNRPANDSLYSQNLEFRGGSRYKVSSYMCPNSGHCHLLPCGFSWLNDTCHFACSFLLVLFSSWLSMLLPHCWPPSPALLLSTGCEFTLLPVTGSSPPPFRVAPGGVLLEAIVSIICESLLHPVSTHNFWWSSPWSGCALQSTFCLSTFWWEVLWKSIISDFTLPGWIAHDLVPTLGEKTSYFHHCPLTEHVFKDIQWARE